jgi:hypothetical protein
VLLEPGDEGVLISHGDHHGGYALRVAGGHLVHHYVHGHHTELRSSHTIPTGRRVIVEVHVTQAGDGGDVALLIDGQVAGTGEIPALARARTGYTGVDVGCDRGVTVGGYQAPARFTGDLLTIEIEADDDQRLDEPMALEIDGATG